MNKVMIAAKHGHWQGLDQNSFGKSNECWSENDRCVEGPLLLWHSWCFGKLFGFNKNHQMTTRKDLFQSICVPKTAHENHDWFLLKGADLLDQSIKRHLTVWFQNKCFDENVLYEGLPKYILVFRLIQHFQHILWQSSFSDIRVFLAFFLPF